MATKKDQIEAVVRQFRRVLHKFSCVEDLPIQLESGVKLTTKAIHTIQAVGEHKLMNVTDVATYFGVTKSAASQMIAKLAAKGLLEKRVAAHSNKEYTLSLTELGREAFDTHQRLHGKGMEELVASLSEFPLAQIKAIPDLLNAFESIMDMRLEE